MAAAPPSPLASSVEKTNGAKLSRLLIDGGTTVLRNLFDRYHPPAHLITNLNSHYGTLNDLLRDGYLSRPQWKKLFATGGVSPDSKNFDISLLFLLLTNICKLRPPRGGWYSKPHPRDTFLEANLARIKYFRNELYGHVTTTGIATPKFNTMWREISAALCGLGLPQAEIDRLKAERGGEQDYIDVLLEWADSEEDIKSQLEDLRQSLTKVQETSEELHKIQLEDRKILQDSKVKIEEVHKAHTKLQQTVGEVRKTQLEDSKTLHDSKVKLEEAHQKQTKTQQTVDEVRQTQIEDRWKLEEVHQVQTKSQQTVDEVHRTQLEDSKTLQDGKVKLDKVHQVQTKTLRTVDEVHKTK